MMGTAGWISARLLPLAVLVWLPRFLIAAEPADGPIHPDAIITMYADAINALRSYDAHLVVTTYRVPSDDDGDEPQPDEANRTIAKVSRQRMDAQRSRTDALSRNSIPITPGSSAMIWDGKRSLAYDASESRAVADAFPIAAIGMSGVEYSQLYKDFDRGYSYLRMIEERAGAITVGETDDSATISIASVLPKLVTANAIAFRLVLSKSCGLMPRRIEQIAREGAALWTVFENDLFEVSPGVWAPIRSRRTVYDTTPDSPRFGRPIGFDVVEVNLKRSSFNLPIEDSVFSIQLPVGTIVHDQYSGITHIVGSPTKNAHLDHLAAAGRLSLQELQQAPEREPYSIVLRRRARSFGFLAILLVPPLFLALLACRRLVRRSPRSTKT